MRFGFLNNFSAQLAVPLSDTATEAELSSGAEKIAEALENADAVALTLFVVDSQGNETKREVVYATAAMDAMVTIERGKEGGTAQAFSPGSGVEARLTAESLRAMGLSDAQASSLEKINSASPSMGSQAQATAPGAVAIGPGAIASVAGGLQVSAVSYVANTAAQSSAMQTVLLSEEIDLTDTAGITEIGAPAGTLIMPDAIDVIVTQSGGGLSYEEQSISPSGVDRYGILARVSPDETLLVYKEDLSDLMIFDLPDFTTVTDGPAGLSNVKSVAFSPDGSMLAIARWSGTPSIEVYHTVDWTVVSGVPVEPLGAVSVHFSRDGNYLAIHYNDDSQGNVVVLNTSDWSVVSTGIAVTGHPDELMFSADSQYLTVMTWDEVKVFQVSDWSEVSIASSINPGKGIAFSPDSAYMALTWAGSNKNIQLIDTSDWSLVSGLPELTSHPEDGTTAVAFTNDAQYLLVGTSFGPGIRVLNTSDWSEVPGVFNQEDGVSDLSMPVGNNNVYVSISSFNSEPLGLLVPAGESALISVGDGESSDSYLSDAEVPGGGLGSRVVFSPLSHHGAETISVSVVTPSNSGKKVKMAVRGYVMEI
ncbi:MULTISPECIES: WD40 repeat domain-containing protein [unclassified Halomonas]|uniref:WD40 repeat domain-containing protein n=1 Tax=unclassified Halomonas TaxID=2609666 RepID=UPI0007DA1EAB|nr:MULTISPECIES: WD40 repeat domain-containing protein [unclassified Halomonas]MBT2788043.1 WD40 repeat domain-containing protein [Halomonas sp. ISL-106]MBT2795792.1 WD40 repeat domain-containing protein [Halomonas sp. ISL-104]OAL61084.1 hypothetical protein A6R74_15900 [Halomonas sp. ALS9]